MSMTECDDCGKECGMRLPLICDDCKKIEGLVTTEDTILAEEIMKQVGKVVGE